MSFLEKNALYHRLKNPMAIDADRELLKKKKPQSQVLQRKFFDVTRQSNEILYALVDVASEEEILDNRKNKKVGAAQKKSSPKRSSRKSKKSSKSKRPAGIKKPQGLKTTVEGTKKSDDVPAGDKEGSPPEDTEKKSTGRNQNIQT